MNRLYLHFTEKISIFVETILELSLLNLVNHIIGGYNGSITVL